MLFNVLALLVTIAVAVSSTQLIRGLSATRPRGPGGPVHDLMEVAFLNGGPARVVDTALAAMASDGRLAVGGPGIVAVVRPLANDPVERAVLQEAATAPHGALHTVRLAVMRNPAVQEIGDGLATRGLMIEPHGLAKWRRWGLTQTICSFVLLPFSIVLTFVQYATHDGLAEGFSDVPVPFVVKVLPAFFAGLIIGLTCAARANRKVTDAGRRAAAEYAMAHVYAADAGHRVALGGLRALPDPVLQAQLVAAARLVRTGRARPAGGHGSDDVFVPAVVWCASSDGSGGSGGGGCGGAGGSTCGGSGGCSSGCGGGSSGGGGGSSCGSSSGGGSSCGGGGGSSCGGGSSSS
ncbi:TIGR04222 domain-containing membrane protein [Streptomyces sp. NPDC002133]|uniref:TIGR04222 domain-containing membrane protein n=1 Tax=Streptomyces sp. NPDC002133 TaxID=3154409 RepID=UPI00332021B1